MKKRIYVVLSLLAAGFLLTNACKKNTTEQTGLKEEKLELPSTLLKYYNDANGQNDDKNKKATIGRVLFYDKNLSANNTIACASCHFQQNGFADGKQFSTGFAFENTSRNSMAFCNLQSDDMGIDTRFGKSSGFFWDLRESSLKSMVLKPISNHIEMGFTNINSIVKKLGQFEHYNNLFTSVYGQGPTTETVADALTLFLSSITSNNSKFDKGLAMVTEPINGSWGIFSSNFPNFTALENKGKALFLNDGCANCHNPSNNFQRGWSNWANIGLDLNYTDPGIDFTTMNGEPNNSQVGAFKIPSLRNIALTAPYMHDGRFATLHDVLNHYSDGIQYHKDLDWELKTFSANGESSPKHFNYSEEDKQAIIAFLKTLTDYEMVNDAKFSSPFKVSAN